jgi:8-oxo-dGTP diphosphatase
MQPERHQARLAAYLILRRDNKIFFLRRANTGYRDGFYTLPAGHIEADESALHAMVREAREEAGVIVEPEDLSFVHVVHRVAEKGPYQYIDFYFEATKWQGEPKNGEPEKCDDTQWFPEAALPDMVIPVVRDMIRAVANGQTYTDIGFS